jgi:hypothetical protein
VILRVYLEDLPQSPCSDLETEREIPREGLNFEQVGAGAKGWPLTTQRAQEPFLLFSPVNFEGDRGQPGARPALGSEAVVVMSARTPSVRNATLFDCDFD